MVEGTVGVGVKGGAGVLAELDAWKGFPMSESCPHDPCPQEPQASFSTLGLEAVSFGNTFPMSLSYTKLSVVGKNAASPDAAFRMYSINSLGSFLVKFW